MHSPIVDINNTRAGPHFHSIESTETGPPIIISLLGSITPALFCSLRLTVPHRSPETPPEPIHIPQPTSAWQGLQTDSACTVTGLSGRRLLQLNY